MTAKLTVLVVDDEPDKRALLAFALENEGYEVHTADDGLAGLSAVDTHQPDLIVTDVMMPRMDGYEMVRRVRSNPQTKFIPVIIQSAARNQSRDVRFGSELGALGYITDPTDLDLLRARARTLLEFKQYLDTCRDEAFTDHLTGLANLRRFERQLEREVARTERYGHPFCLLLLDIDHFKGVNDTRGHDAGDEALRRVANVIQSGTRGIDTGARIGGDEFAVILPETALARGLEVAERICAAVRALDFAPDGGITASLGVAELPSCAGGGEGLREAADAALYDSKRAGRDRVACAPAIGEQNPAPALGVSTK
ncbi:MAG TPA: diguanylate cyclase [Pyrinomonadaceae bacterium]|jgi:diguanylate cyclase (GGDEF)-like protein|nr:diguanylate cyclase [Pyrinomonadaceae bacterium]